MWKAATVT